MKLEHKNIFITGSSRGIGLAIAHKFAQAGANIVLNSRGAISEELLAEFSNYGIKVVPI
ncbi:TPA: SDR family NAD(P)-dependent oxidoreductase, partial [Streptococcus pneumoniae]|nr:SDR family NAD(P)-dependent oxidoreductase [Streptococcus pneumoniae]